MTLWSDAMFQTGVGSSTQESFSSVGKHLVHQPLTERLALVIGRDIGEPIGVPLAGVHLVKHQCLAPWWKQGLLWREASLSQSWCRNSTEDSVFPMSLPTFTTSTACGNGCSGDAVVPSVRIGVPIIDHPLSSYFSSEITDLVEAPRCWFGDHRHGSWLTSAAHRRAEVRHQHQ